MKKILVGLLVATVLSTAVWGQGASVVFGVLSGAPKPITVSASGVPPLVVVTGGSNILQTTLYYERPNIANAADTNFVSSTPYVLAANTLNSNGDTLVIEMITSFSAAASTKSYQCNIGYTAFDAAAGFTNGQTLVSSSTANASIMVTSIGRQSRTGSQAYDVFAMSQFGNAAGSNSSVQATQFVGGVTTNFAVNNNILCAVKDGTGNASAITLRTVRIMTEFKS